MTEQAKYKEMYKLSLPELKKLIKGLESTLATVGYGGYEFIDYDGIRYSPNLIPFYKKQLAFRKKQQ